MVVSLGFVLAFTVRGPVLSLVVVQTFRDLTLSSCSVPTVTTCMCRPVADSKE